MSSAKAAWPPCIWRTISATSFYAVDVRVDPTLVPAGAPRLVLERPGFVERVGTNFRNWDIHPSGDRFVMFVPDGDREVEDDLTVFVVTNWFAELRDRLGN